MKVTRLGVFFLFSFLFITACSKNLPGTTPPQDTAITDPTASYRTESPSANSIISILDHCTLIEGKNVYEIASRVYSKDELVQIREMDGSIEDYNAVYPIECIRKEPNDNYHITYLGESEIAVVKFDKSGTKIGGYKLHISNPKSHFDSLEVGMQLSEVRQIAPEGDYPFMWSSSVVPLISRHATTDGYLCLITYNLVSFEHQYYYNIIEIEWLLI